jgi:hypothetical protein
MSIFYSEGDYMSRDECFGVCSIFGGVDCVVFVFGGEFVSELIIIWVMRSIVYINLYLWGNKTMC